MWGLVRIQNGNRWHFCVSLQSLLTMQKLPSFYLNPRKVKVKLSLCLTKYHAMKTYWRSRSITPHILDLDTRWKWLVSFTPQSLYPQVKSRWYTSDRKLCGPQILARNYFSCIEKRLGSNLGQHLLKVSLLVSVCSDQFLNIFIHIIFLQLHVIILLSFFPT
jgi:hypothetical protein